MAVMPDLISRKPLVLVVDDERVERILICRALQEDGFDVIEATNGAEGIAAVREYRPDIVFLDVFMPEINGFEACIAIRNMPGCQHLPILMVTGADDTKSIERAYDVGATDFMAKPIHWPLLGHRVRYIHRASKAVSDSVEGRAELAETQRIAQLGSWQWNTAADVIQCTAQTNRIFGWAQDITSIRYATFLDHIHTDDRHRVRCAFENALATGSDLNFECRILRPGGQTRTIVTRAKITNIYTREKPLLRGSFQDITELKQAKFELNHLAHYDVLTNLPNRVLFKDRLQQEMARAARDQSMIAVHCLDLDQFKEINNMQGHAVGDRLLQAVADRLLAVVRGADTIARLGGDEFAILQVGIDCPEHAKILQDRIIASLSEPFHVDDQDIVVGTSAGVAFFPMDASDPDQLMVNADIAMYRAKAEGRNGYRFFVAGMDEALRTRKELERDLRLGLEKGWFEIFYQPQIMAKSGAIVGAEALLRMRHPERGLLLPQDLIPLAEDTGLIVPIGAWVLRAASTQAARWHADGMPLRIAVNLSPVQFRQTGLVTTIRSALQEADLAPAHLELEITESMLMHDTTSALDVLRQLQRLGVHIAMDDFGTGYSSLSYLKLFPIDRIKIDRSFVNDLVGNRDAAAIVRAIVKLGHSLEMKTTAEGVETMAQLNYLRGESCDELQGHYFGRPVPIDQFNQLLQTSTAGSVS